MNVLFSERFDSVRSAMQAKRARVSLYFYYKGGAVPEAGSRGFFSARAPGIFSARMFFLHFGAFCVVLSVNTVRASISAQFASSHACIAVHTEENGSK